MSLTAEDVAEIIRLLDQSDFDSLDLEMAGLKLRLRRGADGAIHDQAGPPQEPDAGGPRSFEPAGRIAQDGRRRAAPTPAQPSAPPPRQEGNVVDIPSPLLGIFYRAPKPGAPPFVETGQTVAEDTIIGIIEVMKLMNSIRAGVSGVVAEIPAANGALVEYGEPLIRVRPGD